VFFPHKYSVFFFRNLLYFLQSHYLLQKEGRSIMIQNDDILNMNFYKKEKFTGSYQGMRYLIQKDQEEDAEDENVKHDIFRVTIWPGPYNFASTADDLKSSAVFPFTPEGKEQVVGWLNEQWSARRTEWPGR